jgi:putative glutamine amidotransferase
LEREVWTNSLHHQAVDKVGKGLLLTGLSEDGIVESFEHPDYKFVAGVQWHPEMMSGVYKEQLKLFKAFIKKTCID